MNNAQRDPTAFAALAPGAQTGTRLPIIGGTSNYLGQLYLDGMPAETINQQGDNRLVSQAVSVDAVDQFQEVTSTPPAEYMGAGATNFTMKSGGTRYHGQASDFVRNTIFDAWSFTSERSLPRCVGADPGRNQADRTPERAFAERRWEGASHGRETLLLLCVRQILLPQGANPAAYTVPTMLRGQVTSPN